MKTVGDLLKNARIKQQLTLDQIASYSKISKRYLIAIEDNDFQQLPPAAFSKGFLHTYATLVGLDPKTVLAIFRRDFDQDDRGRIIPRSFVDPIKSVPKGVTPQRLTIVLSLLVGLSIVIFFLVQIINFTSKPPLAIHEPSDNSVLISPITVRGTTDAQATITINNKQVIVSSTGDFTTQLELSPGEHTLIIVAQSRSEKKTTLERTVYIDQLPVENQ